MRIPLSLCAAIWIATAHASIAQTVENRIESALADFVRPCVTYISTGQPVGISGKYTQKNRKLRFVEPNPNRVGWLYELEFKPRRGNRECKLRVQGAVSDQSTVNRLGEVLIKQMVRQNGARSVGVMDIRGRRQAAFEIGKGIYTVSVASGGRNTETIAFVTFRSKAE